MTAINHLTLAIKKHLQRFWHDEQGATALEYGLIAALIAAGIVTILGTVKTNLIATFQSIANSLIK